VTAPAAIRAYPARETNDRTDNPRPRIIQVPTTGATVHIAAAVRDGGRRGAVNAEPITLARSSGASCH